MLQSSGFSMVKGMFTALPSALAFVSRLTATYPSGPMMEMLTLQLLSLGEER